MTSTLATPSKQKTMEPSVYWMNIVVLASEKRLTPSKDANAKKRKKGVLLLFGARRRRRRRRLLLSRRCINIHTVNISVCRKNEGRENTTNNNRSSSCQRRRGRCVTASAQ